MIIKKDHQPAVLMFVLFSTKRQCACYQISHSAPISRATISSSRLVKAISNWESYQNHVQQVLEISCLEMHGPCTLQPGINVGLYLLNFGFLLHKFAHFVHALCLFKALRLFFLTNFPDPTVIPCPTSIPDSRV